ncbi:MAG: AAA family ATPase, partial [Bdellovibrionales bacterium]|nr:AAA family ATPase [Bdellovibrionales bacterium]
MHRFTSQSRDSSATEDEVTVLRGAVTHVAYRSPDGTFGVLRVEQFQTPAEGIRSVTVVGPISSRIQSGISISAHGRWQTHEKFGKQFRADFIAEELPKTTSAIERYLTSGVMPGVGPVLAKRIVETFGERTIEIIDSEPDRLLEVPGIGEKRVEEIREVWVPQTVDREIALFLKELAVPAGLARRIMRRYGNRTIDQVRDDPYRLIIDISGVGFRTADKLAASLGVEPSSGQRIRAGLYYALRDAADSGHCYLPLGKLIERAANLLQLPLSEDHCREILEQAASEGLLEQQADHWYLPTLAAAEQTLAELIAERMRESSHPRRQLPHDLVRELASRPFLATGATEPSHLSPEQQLALELAGAHTLVAITGGPGCGKTTVIQVLVTLFRRAGLSVALAAPTGRAAQRLAHVTGAEASTIHRLLKYDPMTQSFVHDRENPIECDALIVDESSMIDLQLAASLCS